MRPPRIAGLALAALAVAAILYGALPRRADLRDFDPAGVARLETAMWRDYYEHRYAALFGALYQINRGEYRFSPWDSIRLSYYAAVAAKRFQPTRSRTEAQSALPALTRYYDLLARRGGERFDAATAASLELDWWQMRRENATPAEYARPIARTWALVYATAEETVTEPARLRAEMMRYRDDRASGIAASDWARIEATLTEAYVLLGRAVRR